MIFITSWPGPKVIKKISCLIQLSTKFILLINVKMPTMKKVNKQCLLDTPRTERVREKNLSSYSSNQQTLVLKRRFQYNMCKQKL